MPRREEGIWIRGNRFQALIAPSRKKFDIDDSLFGDIFAVLTEKDGENLYNLASYIEMGFIEKNEKFGRFKGDFGDALPAIVDTGFTKDGKNPRFSALSLASLADLLGVILEATKVVPPEPPSMGAKEKKGWREYFRAFKVPEKILDMVRAGVLRDDTWQQDLMPVFTAILADRTRLDLFVDHPDPERRKMGPRFELRMIEPLGLPDTVIETEDVDEALEALRRMIDRHGGPRPV